MSSCRLTRRAEEDLLEIFLFGLERFGLAQAERYKASFERCFAILADNPRLGRTAEAIAPGRRHHEHEGYVILYEEARDGVLVAALVHGRSVHRLVL